MNETRSKSNPMITRVTNLESPKNYKTLPVALAIAAFAAITIGVLLFGYFQQVSNLSANQRVDSSANSDTGLELPVGIEFPLVVLAPFKELRSNIELPQLKNSTVYFEPGLGRILSSNQQKQVLDLLGVASWVDFPETSLLALNESKYSGDIFVIAHFANTNLALKSMKLSNLSLWRDDTYGLKVAGKLSDFAVDKQTTIATALQIKEVDINFTLAKVNRMFMGGEIIPARAVDRLFLNSSNNYTFLFDRIKTEIQTADLAVALLENPISGNPKPCTGCTQFVGDARNAKGFAEVGIDLLGFGNHAGDGGLAAVQETEVLLEQAGIGFTGVSSKDLNDAGKLVIREFAGKKLGFLSFDDVAWFYWASASKWGTNRFSAAGSKIGAVDKDRIKKVITAAKSEVDYLMVMASWGVEYTDTATKHQQELAHTLIDNGADLVIASHPHWVQNFEIYQDKPIFYSLGNFIFDQTHTDPTRQGIWVNGYYYNGALKGFEIIPHLTCGYHQTNVNLANKVINGEMTYAQVDAMSEKQGCIYWQPKSLEQSRPEYKQIWQRFIKGTKLS